MTAIDSAAAGLHVHVDDADSCTVYPKPAVPVTHGDDDMGSRSCEADVVALVPS